MAKISGLSNMSPDQWHVEFIPWSPNFQSNVWLAIGTRNDYLYIFTQPDGYFPFLTRIHLDYLENPTEGVQYWSRELAWKNGINQADALPILDN